MPAIEFVWWIEPNNNPRTRDAAPFAVIRQHASGQTLAFPCQSLEEAHGKLQAIADTALASDHEVGIA